MNLFDHLGSLTAAGGFLLLVATFFLVRTEESTDEVRLDAAQQTQDAITQTVRIDLENLGAQRPAGTSAIRELSPDRFEFYGIADTSGTPAVVTYRKQHLYGDSTAARYRVQRYVDGNRAGQSSDLVTQFEVVPYDANGVALDSLAGTPVAMVEVRMQWALPFDRDESNVTSLAKRISWTTRVRPTSLRYTY